MRIGHRIVLSLAVMVIMVVTISTFTLWATSQMDGVIHLLVAEELPSIRLVDDVISRTSAIATDEQRYVFFGEDDVLAHHETDLRNLRSLIAQLGTVGSHHADPVVADLKRKGASFIALDREMIRLHQEGEVLLARHLASFTVAASRQEIIEDCGKLAKLYRQELAAHESDYLSMGGHLKQAACVIALLSLLVAALLAIQSIRALIFPLGHLVETTKAIRKGDYDRRAHIASSDELRELADSMNHMVGVLQQHLLDSAATNVQLLSMHERMQHDLRLARRLQKSIVPREFAAPGVRVFARIAPAREVGGDFYELNALGPDGRKLSCIIGDVMGKGVPAALLMMLSLTVLREVSRSILSPGRLFEVANARIREQVQDDDIATGVSSAAVLIDADRSHMRYAKAGHEDILLWRAASGAVETLEARGIFLGVFADEQYEEREAELHPGDKVILYTDGITEARNASKEMFGIERLTQTIAESGRVPANELGWLILKQVAEHQGETEPNDDIALVIVEVAALPGIDEGAPVSSRVADHEPILA